MGIRATVAVEGSVFVLSMRWQQGEVVCECVGEEHRLCDQVFWVLACTCLCVGNELAMRISSLAWGEHMQRGVIPASLKTGKSTCSAAKLK